MCRVAKKYFLQLVACYFWVFLSHDNLFAQDWRLIGNEPTGHNPRHCSRCKQSSGAFPRKHHTYFDKRISGYYTSQDNLLDDTIVYFNDRGEQEKIDVKQLSIIGFPETITHKNGTEIDLLSCGFKDSKTLVVERKINPTPNQVITKRFQLPIANLSQSSQSVMAGLTGDFTIRGGSFPAFVIEIDHARQNIVLRGGQWGFPRNVNVSDISEGFNVIERLHDKQFKVIKDIGLLFLRQEQLIFENLHTKDPIDVELEAKKEKESFEEGKIIALNNEIIRQNYELQKALWLSLGGDLSGFYAKIDSPRYLVHHQYYAHPEWSQVAKVYEDTHDWLAEKFGDWKNSVSLLPSVALKKAATGGPTVDQLNKLNSLGSETLEGVYKIRLNLKDSYNPMIGELKVYVYPNNEGRFWIKYSSGIDGNGRSRNHFYECDFTFAIETSADGASKELSIESTTYNPKSTKDAKGIYSFKFLVEDSLKAGGEELAIYYDGQLLKHQRIRHYVIELDGGFRRKVKY